VKVALVTGGAKRLGLEFSKALAKDGYSIALSYRSDAEEARRAVDLLRKEEGVRAEAFRSDLAVDGAPLKLFEEVFSSPLFSDSVSPRLDALVHAASPWIPKPFASVTVSDWEAVFRAGPRAHSHPACRTPERSRPPVRPGTSCRRPAAATRCHCHPTSRSRSTPRCRSPD